MDKKTRKTIEWHFYNSESGTKWDEVVSKTYTTYQFQPQWKIMYLLYQQKMNVEDIIDQIIPQRTYFRWRDKWLKTALSWAKEYELLEK